MPDAAGLGVGLIVQANPAAATRRHRDAIAAALNRVLDSGRFVLGGEGAAFEREFAAWIGVNHAAACASGTDALTLALQACGIGPGAAVAVPGHTAVATVAAVALAGAMPLLLDVDPAHYTLDPVELDAVLRQPPPGLPPIRAVIPVHLYGQPADMQAVMATCRQRGLAVIEDCSQAHGAAFTSGDLAGLRVGAVGTAGAFSFYPTKNLAALGDGGLVTTDDAALAGRVARLRQYGWDGDRVCHEPGRNSRLDELQAAILRARLPLLAAANERRRAVAARYDEALAGGSVAPPARRPGCTHVFHQYVLRSPDRARLRRRLESCGVATEVHYPLPIHRHPAYAGLPRGPSDCRAATAAAGEVFSLPIHPDLTDAEVARVCAALRLL